MTIARGLKVSEQKRIDILITAEFQEEAKLQLLSALERYVVLERCSNGVGGRWLEPHPIDVIVLLSLGEEDISGLLCVRGFKEESGGCAEWMALGHRICHSPAGILVTYEIMNAD